MEENTSVKALDRAFAVLDILQSAEEPLGVNEIAKRCEISPATTFRILKTCQSHGWVYQDKDEKYNVGHRLCAPTPNRQGQFLQLLRECAYFTMQRLSDIEQEAMNLVVRDLDRCYILGQSRTEKIVDYVPPVGTVLPFHASACGKVLLSELEEPLRSTLLDRIPFRRMTESTITARDAFTAELARVREQGYALDAHESQDVGFCIAVPIRAPQGEILAALSFSGFIGRRTVDEIDRYVALLQSASDEITKTLFSSGKDRT